MTLSTMDIPCSPDMGGKEALSALGWSRASRGEFCEHWEFDFTDKDGLEATAALFFSFKPFNGPWRVRSTVCNRREQKARFLTADEMRACIRRIEELEAGDAE